MRNWLGQEVEPGVVVYRGARDGNTSSYKIGRVESINGLTARVHWLYEPSQVWRKVNGVAERLDRLIGEMDSKGSPSIDSLVVLPEKMLERLDQARYFVRRWKDGDMDTKTLNQALDSILGT